MNGNNINNNNSVDAMERSDSESTPLTSHKSTSNVLPFRDRKPKEKHQRSWRERCISIMAISAALLAFLLCLRVLISSFWDTSLPSSLPSPATADATTTTTTTATALALYDELGRYMIRNYDALPPFSDFLPALAGYYGKPLYAFYVNRGQGIASFGVESKDYPIMEFQPANKAYQMTALLGFRTFLQGSRKGKKMLLEPFSPLHTRFDETDPHLPLRIMYVGSNEMQLQEVDHVNGIEMNTTYFVLPEEDFGAFVKRTTITNTASSPLTVGLLDGLAKIEPAGGKLDKLLKTMGRTLEGFMNVYSPMEVDDDDDDDDDESLLTMPFFRLTSQPQDGASVVAQTAGHFCLSILEDNDENPRLLPIVYDTNKIFGDDTTLLRPVALQQSTIASILQNPQYGAAKTSSAFAALDAKILQGGQSITISTFYGLAQDIADVPIIARTLLSPGFCQYKATRTREVLKQITAAVTSESSLPLWDGHVSQMYLDNALRGGIPGILGEVDDDARLRNSDEDPRLKTYHLFSRVHGDLERDYNDFVIAPTFFSEGPGNFRDIVQNRRSDVIFNPRIGSFNINSLLSFIQADGYNPLKIEAVTFTIEDMDTCMEIANRAVGRADGHRAQRESLTGILNRGPFRPGQLFLLMEQQDIELIISRQDYIDMVVAAAESHPMAVYTMGYWADHWTYLMEHVEAYLMIYPDWEERIMFDTQLPFFFSTAYVKPRSEKYVLSTTFDGKGKHVRQLNATEDEEEEKVFEERFISNQTGWYNLSANWQHDSSGEVFTATPMAKLFLLATVKFATRDAYGMGIEYEGGRPGWDDANNGLVGMLGSGMPETFELSVLLKYILAIVSRVRRPLHVPKELFQLIKTINAALQKVTDKSGPDKLTTEVPKPLFEYWDTVATAREKYRERTKVLFDGSMAEISTEDLIAMLQDWLADLDRGIARAMSLGSRGHKDPGDSGITPTYFSYKVSNWTLTGRRNKEGHALVDATAMTVEHFPLFLEGPTRMLKIVQREQAVDVYHRVKTSPLRDDKLKMYLISASLKGQSVDMGREMAFAPGWLENESVWLHMSYKYYLQILKHGLFDEFYDEMRSGGMLPFMDPKVYGRSLMECSSFIASSAFDDPSVQGRGFLPRLSGSTAEFLSMWVLMMIGPKPFFYEKNEMRLQLVPALPRWLFKEVDGATPYIRFKLFGSIDVTYYHLRGDENLYRTPPTRYVITLLDGTTFHIHESSIPNSLADKIRRIVFVDSIDVYFEE